jgi:ABC-type phosphate transport system auxiliary subunit
MPLDKSVLMGLLTAVDKELERKIILVAAGGTAMTLLDLKPSTIDIDFTGPHDDIQDFNRIQKSIPHGFKVDTWTDGAVFSQMLPGDYLDRSVPVKTTGLKKILLKALHPLDIVVSKIGRLNERDLQDIESCINKFKLERSQIEKRAHEVHYVGNEKVYELNVQHVLRRFFG